MATATAMGMGMGTEMGWGICGRNGMGMGMGMCLNIQTNTKKSNKGLNNINLTPQVVCEQIDVPASMGAGRMNARLAEVGKGNQVSARAGLQMARHWADGKNIRR
jgi:hypothetical protein